MSSSPAEKFHLKILVDFSSEVSVLELLASKSGLSKSRVKDAMNKGAVWLRMKRGGGLRRVRRATSMLKEGDCLELYYDEEVLTLKPPKAVCLCDRRHYSVWYKPPGLLAQGTKYGDHCSLLRTAEIYFGPSREVYLVHRLDREASGIMLLAHRRDVAASLSKLFREGRIEKVYRAEVLGRPGDPGMDMTIRLSLDGKPAATWMKVESYDSATDTSRLSVIIATGRLHQIRRHLFMIGHPVMGDPKYGEGNKNLDGMKLFAASVKFRCPVLKKEVFFTIAPDQNF